jgi:hypothetical protein
MPKLIAVLALAVTGCVPCATATPTYVQHRYRHHHHHRCDDCYARDGYTNYPIFDDPDVVEGAPPADTIIPKDDPPVGPMVAPTPSAEVTN